MFEPALNPMFKDGVCVSEACAVPATPLTPALFVSSVNSLLGQYTPLYVIAMTAAACALMFLLFPRIIYALANLTLYLILMDIFQQYQRHVVAGKQEAQVLTLGFLGVGVVLYFLSLAKVFVG